MALESESHTDAWAGLYMVKLLFKLGARHNNYYYLTYAKAIVSAYNR